MTLDKLHARGVRISPDFKALAGYGVLTALFFAPILLGLRVFPPGDFTDHFLPFSLFQRSELLAGRLPLWNPYTFSGHPFLADTQAAVFYPLSNLVLLLTLPWSSPAARLYWLQVEAVIQFALAGWFTYLLARDLVHSRPAAFLAGCVFAFSGYLTGYPPLQLAVLRTAIWLPLILWLLRRGFAQPTRRRWWVGAGLAYAVAFLAGHPQTFLFVSYAVAGWLLFLLLMAHGRRAGYLWRIAAFYALAAALSAAQLWPSLEFTALSVRADVTYAFVSGGFPLRDTGQMLLPGILSQFSPLYVGLVPLGLAFVGAAVGHQRSTFHVPRSTFHVQRSAVSHQRSTFNVQRSTFTPRLFFATVVVLALLASFGNHGFLYPVLYRWAPGWAMFRGQERAAYLVAFALSILAGYGAVALGGLSRRQRRIFGAGFATVIAAGMIVLAVILRGAADVVVVDAVLLRDVGVGLCVLLAFAAVLWRDLAGRTRTWALVGLALAELFVANLVVNLAPAQPMPPAAAVVVQTAVRSSSPGDGLPARVHNEGPLFEDYGMLVGVEDVSGSSPLRLARYASLLPDFPRERLWRLTGVQFVLSARRDLYVPGQVVAELPAADGPIYLHKLEAANPRAWVVNAVRVLDDGAARPVLGDAGFDPESTAVLAPPARLGLEDGTLALAGANSVRLERLAPNRLRVHVQSEHGGLLVVSENWMPGWRATVRGTGDPAAHAAPVLRADLTLLGVPVAPGESIVDLTYWPDSVRFGLLISAGAGLLLVLVAVVRISKSANRQISESASQQIGRRSVVGGPQTSNVKRLSSIIGRWAMPAILLLAFALRAFRLGYQELRGDEALGRLFSLEPFRQIVRSTIALREPHPVASYFVEKVWLGLAGQTEFAVRFASLWFGVLAVALLYRLGRRLGLGRAAATLGAALLAISPYAIWHSQDARMYSMSLALTTASLVLMLEALARRRLIYWAGYVAVTLLALHTHYYAAYIVIAENLFVFGRALWVRAERRNVRPWLAAQVTTGLLYLPWLVVARATLTGYYGNGDSPGFVAMWLRSLSVFAAGESVPDAQQPLLAALAAALIVIGAARLAMTGPRSRRALWLLGLYLFVPLLATWVGALSRPIFNERYLVAALPAFCLLLAAAAPLPEPVEGPNAAPTESPVPEPVEGPTPAPGKSRPYAFLGVVAAALLAVTIGAGLLSLERHYDDPVYSKTVGWRLAGGLLARYSAGWPADKVRVAQTYPDPTLWYYYDGAAAHLVLPPAAHDDAGAAREVVNLVDQGVERVVVIVQPTAGWDERDIASHALAQAYTLVSDTPIGGWFVRVFDRPPAELPGTDVAFTGGLRLTGASVPVARLIPGDVLPVYLRWAGDPAAVGGGEKITLQLLDASGELVAQIDWPFGAADLNSPGTGYAVALPRDLAPGAYRLIVALYDPSAPGGLRRLTAAGADHAELAQLTAP